MVEVPDANTEMNKPAGRPLDSFFAVVSITGVTGSLLLYGVLQERIMTTGFGPEGALFGHSVFLVLCNRACTVIVALLMSVATRSSLTPAAPLYSYAAASFTNVVATACQYEALKYVSFAVQTIAKSAKTLPVMIWSTLVSRKRYQAAEYGQAVLITAGCAIFVLTGNISSSVAERVQPKEPDNNLLADSAMLMGISLMVLYLAVDGLTSTWQDRLFQGYNMPICDQVLYTTAFSTVFSLVASLFSNQMFPAIKFLQQHPEAIWWIVALSAASSAVQLFISYTIKHYGAMVFALIMTTRQFFAILLSSFLFLKPLTLGQVMGTAMVFGTLYAKAHTSGSSQQRLPTRRQSTGAPPFTAAAAAKALHPDLLAQLKGAGASAALLKPAGSMEQGEATPLLRALGDVQADTQAHGVSPRSPDLGSFPSFSFSMTPNGLLGALMGLPPQPVTPEPTLSPIALSPRPALSPRQRLSRAVTPESLQLLEHDSDDDHH